MFLQTVEPRSGAGDGGVMITQNGEFVVAKPNEYVAVVLAPSVRRINGRVNPSIGKNGRRL